MISAVARAPKIGVRVSLVSDTSWSLIKEWQCVDFKVHDVTESMELDGSDHSRQRVQAVIAK